MMILIANAGSTSLKFKLYDFPKESALCAARVERVGSAGDAIFSYENARGYKARRENLSVADYRAGVQMFLRALTDAEDGVLESADQIDAVGFKTVLAMGFSGVHILDGRVLRGMEDALFLAPVHNRAYLQVIDVFQALLPDCPLVGSFETAFHASVPAYRRVYGVPYEWRERYGVERLGYHGASHSYIADKLQPYRRVISCHLGGSCSVCAILDGKSVDISFGLSLQAGVNHANRSGDIDPYIIPYMQSKGMALSDIMDALEHKGGLMGISGVSGDMRTLREAARAGNARARLAIDVFINDVIRYIGAYAAELNGVDAIAFTGGIGENDAETRARVCESLAFLGARLDDGKNAAGEEMISAANSHLPLFVILADEEIVTARNTYRALSKA